MQRGKSGAIRITSSARPSRESGTVMPSAFAVFKLTTNWILIACYTGRSAGFSPFKMRPRVDAGKAVRLGKIAVAANGRGAQREASRAQRLKSIFNCLSSAMF